MSAFQDITEATKLWIKGDEFTVDRLLGPTADRLAARFTSGSMCIARLAPQDYHRFVVVNRSLPYFVLVCFVLFCVVLVWSGLFWV